MALDQMISDGVSHDYARHGRFQPDWNRRLAASPVKLPCLKPSKISTKPVAIFVENLGRGRSD